MIKTVDYELILSKAVELPMVRIDREEFLRSALKKYFPEHIVEQAVEHNPAYAGISTEQIKKIAKECINYETTKVSTISFVSGIPGGWAMLGTLPADITQYFGHIIRIVQKLVYLYGWEDFCSENGYMDDGTANILTLFIGIMFGVDGATQTITKISAAAAQKASKAIAQKALTKGTIYPIVKKTAQILGIRMTKEIFAKGVSKVIPLIGGTASGVLTFFTYKPMAKKLRKHLATLPCADVNYYKNGLDTNKPIDVEFDEKFVLQILEGLDREINSEKE